MSNKMKRILLSTLAALAVVVVAAQGRVEEFAVKSDILGVEKKCTVYLPEGYDSTQKSYPVLYLLHGAKGCHSDWTKKGMARRIADESIAEGTALPMVIVMPDASGEGADFMGRNMGYFDVPGWSYEQFFFREFLPAVEKNYRIVGDKRHRAISGLSMGGGGTAAYALRHPEVFGSACPMSGLLDTIPGQRGYEDVFVQSVARFSPLATLRAMTDEQVAPLRTVRWWVECGDDDFLYESNIEFYRLMRQRNIPLQFRMRDGGHTWRFWEESLPHVLTFVSIGFAE